MKIKLLTSSDPRFQTLEFHDGLNIIVGEKVFKEDKKKTSNGIGKSLSLICIDYMLGKGTQSKEVSKLKKILEEHKIKLTLLFEHNDKQYTVERTYNKIWLNYAEIVNSNLVLNAFENFDNPTYNDIVSLLQEEFDDSLIEKSTPIAALNARSIISKSTTERPNLHNIRESKAVMKFSNSINFLTFLPVFHRLSVL